jgi:NAD(P)-dependent dehydrogenase (short-subunit alcohol dehydrogenase family)
MTGDEPESRLRLEERVALVTGANSPIGAAIAQRLAGAGAKVVLGAHRETNRVKPLAADLGAPMLVADLADPSSAKRLVDETIEVAGQLDVLVNNAALQTVEPLASTTAEAWDEVLDTNLRATHLMMRAALGPLSGNDGGAVVNVASVEAHQPAAGHGHYAVSKAGLVMLTRAAALEYGPAGVRVNSVSPGLIDDGTLAERWPSGVERWLAAAPLRRIGTPGDVADAVIFLASPMARWVTGADLVVDGGILAVPTW